MLGDTLGLAGDGAHEDDAAADLEVLVGLAGDEELAAGVDVEDAVELLGGDVLDVAEGHDAAVGADDVELAPEADGLGEHLDDLVHVRHVGLDGPRVGAGLLDGRAHLLSRLLAVGVVDNHLGAAAAELHGHLAADTATCDGLLAGRYGVYASEMQLSKLPNQASQPLSGAGMGCTGCPVGWPL